MHLCIQALNYNKRITRDQYSGIYTLCTFTIHFRGVRDFVSRIFYDLLFVPQILRI